MSLEHAREAQAHIERLSEIEQKEAIAREFEREMLRKRLILRLERDKKLAYLRSLVERGIIRLRAADKIVHHEALEDTELQPIFDRIEAIEMTDRIDEILPPDLRITKKEYITSLSDEVTKHKTILKLEHAIRELTIRSRGWSHHPGISIFRAFFQLLDRNLQTNIINIKKHTLDIRDSLIT